MYVNINRSRREATEGKNQIRTQRAQKQGAFIISNLQYGSVPYKIFNLLCPQFGFERACLHTTRSVLLSGSSASHCRLQLSPRSGMWDMLILNCPWENECARLHSWLKAQFSIFSNCPLQMGLVGTGRRGCRGGWRVTVGQNCGCICSPHSLSNHLLPVRMKGACLKRVALVTGSQTWIYFIYL